MMQRSHAEDTLTRRLDHADLDDVGEDNRDEEAADDDREQLGLGEDRQAGDGATQGERTGVTHEDLRGRRVPPQEARQGTDEGGTEDRQVKRVAGRVAIRRVGPQLRAGLNTLEVRDERVGAEDEDGHARRQAV